MESGKVSDAQITASSTYSSSYLPQNARLNKHLGSCAWTTKSGGQVGSWHQVDFGDITHVTGVATQGNCANSERVKSYMISYSRDNTKWTQYRESGTSKVSITVRKGSNSYMIVQCYFLVFILRMRISELRRNKRTSCGKNLPKTFALS